MQKIENTIISSLMWNVSGDFLEATHTLKPEFFSTPLCRHLFEVLTERAMAAKPLNDPIMLVQDLTRMGYGEHSVTDIITLSTETPPQLDIADYTAALKDNYMRQQVKRELTRMVQYIDNPTMPLDKTVTMAVNALVEQAGLTDSSTLTLTDILDDIRQQIERNARGEKMAGFPTGFTRLDENGGLHTQDLVIVAGASSNGKTSLAVNILVNAVRHTDASALIFSMEMSAMQIGARIMSPEVAAPSSVILYRPLRERGQAIARQAIQTLQMFSDRLFIGDSSIQTIDAILASIRLHHARYKVRLVMVDYLQIIGLTTQRNLTHEDALADAARRLKNIAKELDICVVLLSQLNREGLSSGNPEPTAAQLRGSGQINEAADLTLLVYRPEVYSTRYRPPFNDTPPEGTAMLKIDKDRNGTYGGIGAFIVHFHGPTTRFYEEPVSSD